MHVDDVEQGGEGCLRPFLIFLALILVVFLGACENRVETPATERAPYVEPPPSVTQMEISPLDESPVVGRWEVVDFYITPVAAIDEQTALNWLGQVVIYSADVVGFQEELCDEPTFREHDEIFDQYFEDFEVDPAQFDIFELDVEVITIDCADQQWLGPGSELIRVQGDTVVVVFDGVFLIMEPYRVLDSVLR